MLWGVEHPGQNARQGRIARVMLAANGDRDTCLRVHFVRPWITFYICSTIIGDVPACAGRTELHSHQGTTPKHVSADR